MNEENLISKKELLEITDISYGQLYRWKRKGLIPETWFIRKATFTGQETFFPRDQVLSRIDKIKNMKEDISLDDLADVFSPTLTKISLTISELTKRNIVTRDTLAIYLKYRGNQEELNFNEIISAFILNKLILAGSVNLDEASQLLDVLQAGLNKFKSESSEIYLTRKLGIFICFMVSPPCKICLDQGLKIIEQINLANIIEELKLKLI